ncbi:MAG: hypothetical protein KGM24_05810 [Elusimicrobia bacterium]|nr:hypothetical protein [Elusimicrobiota bacterium]
MGQRIWETLERFRGRWVALDAEGRVLDAGDDLDDLRARAARARTFVFACGEGPAR